MDAAGCCLCNEDLWGIAASGKKSSAALGQLALTHVQKLKDLEQAVASGEISKLEWRKAYQAEQSRYVEEKKTVDKDFTATPLTPFPRP